MAKLSHIYLMIQLAQIKLLRENARLEMNHVR